MWLPPTRSLIMNGPFVTWGWKFQLDLPKSAGPLSVLMNEAGMQVDAALAKKARNGPKGLRKVSVKVVVSTLVALTKPNGSLGSVVGKAPRSPTAGLER